MSPSDLATFGSSVEQQIAKFPLLFPSPVPALSELAATRNALKAAIVKAVNGSLVDRQQRNSLTQEYCFMLNRLAGYVAMEAANNENALEISMFNLSRIRKAIGPLEGVTDVRSMLLMCAASMGNFRLL